jgi:hypothetical protein
MLRRLSVFAFALAAASATSVLPTTAMGGSAAELCFGLTPTLVGSPGQWHLVGTEGPDVVVTNGSGDVETGGGDDLVCITGAAVRANGKKADPRLSTGPGRDRVDAALTKTPFSTSLGAGPDEYDGGPGPDVVVAGDQGGQALDPIWTAGGRDVVYVSGGADVVDLGRNDDQLYVGGQAAGAVLHGGDGDDLLGIDLMPVEPHSWTLNNRTERLMRDGKVVTRWDSFTHFRAAARGPITFVGSDLAEKLTLGRAPSHGPFAFSPRRTSMDVRMGDGDDVFAFDGGMPGSRFDGGAGTDRLEYEVSFSELVPHTDVLFDLSAGLLRDRQPTEEFSRRAVNFEDAALSNGKGLTTIVGSEGANSLSTSFNGGTTGSTTILGKGGDDKLIGGLGRDLLVGGPGRDVAKGGDGFDRCDAEVRQGCEG